ncbi:FtsP/CotA-like multicopper oxidase with cupredoxin domain [Arthrobacter stackebrandtii]|uniref:FtsP/CotA-like multicopper oxidase with cupredoxin domain n=1 Tax=Arthrobacter stackebrandtii TaxID=272161 RepID=A0ABS4YRG9_9MICC|nr:multicopper oxidase family protein [Arthrobacter stackebrandtii]MBP2411391.1 FtsP/CotA-like multicopper oxidase with cupredoxin domain [Arthrobacter stackebrandtii]PYH00319.1 copper oxidase [Arthrobacter stackebrandtii]
MSVTALLAADLIAAVATVAVWLGAAVLAVGQLGGANSAKARWGLGVNAAGIAALAALWWMASLLARHGWWFVQEKISFALPILSIHAAIATVLAAGPLTKAATGRRVAGLPLLVPVAYIGAAAAAIAGIIARLVVGYPLESAPAVVPYLLVLLATALSWLILAHVGRRAVGSLAGFTAFVLIGSLTFVWLGPASEPGVLAGGHGHAGTVHGAQPSLAGTAAQVPLTDLPADLSGLTGRHRQFTLTAARQRLTLSGGVAADAWTYGSVPGPELRVFQGDRVSVALHNTDISEGVTIHWHGYDVPNKMDGVAAVTQNAVLPGETFTYDFVARDAGSYWYHTHQVSSDGVRRGLYGMFIVLPRDGIAESLDLSVPVHTFRRAVVFGSSDAAQNHSVPIGTPVRLRVANTDQQPHRLRLTGSPYRVVAVDGHDVMDPTDIAGQPLRLPAGGRVDLALRMPEAPVSLRTDSAKAVSLNLLPVGVTAAPSVSPPRSLASQAMDAAALPDVDLLRYGRPTPAAQPRGTSVVEATMVLDRLPRLMDGLPGFGYTVNGSVYPHIPGIEVTTGQVVRLTVANRGWETHPMDVHGHHVLVLARNGVPAIGSPLWLDTFDVQPGEVWEVALVADNPGVWMDTATI